MQTACGRCGRALPPDVAFCGQCGAPVGEQTPVTQPETEQTQPVTQQTPPVPEQTPPAPEWTQPVPQAAQPIPEQTQPIPQPVPQPVVPQSPPAAYEPFVEEPPPRPSRAGRIFAGIAIGVALGVLIRIVGSVVLASGTDAGEIVASLPVGPEGAEVSFDGDGRLSVPEGALAEEETIEVRRTTVPQQVRATSPAGLTPLVFPPGSLVVYTFGPATLVFNRPVTIILPAPPPPQRGLVFVLVGGQIRFFQSTLGTGTVSIQVTSFNFSGGQGVFVGT